jgi:hypothetical protein
MRSWVRAVIGRGHWSFALARACSAGAVGHVHISSSSSSCTAANDVATPASSAIGSSSRQPHKLVDNKSDLE